MGTQSPGSVRATVQGPWTVTESKWDPARANYFETVFTVGNGRLGTRGSLEEGHLGAVSGTFLAGVYDAHDSPVIDLVNAPDWLNTVVYADSERLDVDSLDVVDHERVLDLKTGVLQRRTVFALGDGARVEVATQRFASMADRNQCRLRVRVTPLDREVEVSITTRIDAHRRNMESLPIYPEGTVFDHERKWDKWALSRHLREKERGFDVDAGYIVTQTIDSDVEIAYAMRVLAVGDVVDRTRKQRHERLEETVSFRTSPGEPVGIDKVVGIATSRDVGVDRPPLERALAATGSTDFDDALAASSVVWERLWESCDCEIVGDDRAALALRFSVYHLLIAANPDDPTVNIGAKSLSGEGYRGHVFWDTEIMMLPFFLFTQPEAARALLGYRHHTLVGAREVAADSGFRGARYPWESADTGREECPVTTPDGQNRFYTRDEELHVTADVAYAICRYVEVTGDVDYLYGEGAEILFDTAQFWVSRCVDDGDRVVLRTVMGPDEFHSHVDNNAFTNRMVRWHLEQAVRVYREMAQRRPGDLAALRDSLSLTDADVEVWADLAARIVAPVDPDCGLIEQFDGYFDRREVPISVWDENDMPQYPAGYHHFNCEDTTLLKQPDAVMLMFMLPDDYSPATRRANYDFYEARTLHKSSLSPSIHAIVGLQVGNSSKAEQYFARSAFVDLDDNQGNTEEGMHIASAAGTWQVAVHGFGGFLAGAGGLSFAPALPESWERLKFAVHWRGRVIRADLGHAVSRFTLIGDGAPEEIHVHGESVVLTPGVEAQVAVAATV